MSRPEIFDGPVCATCSTKVAAKDAPSPSANAAFFSSSQDSKSLRTLRATRMTRTSRMTCWLDISVLPGPTNVTVFLVPTSKPKNLVNTTIWGCAGGGFRFCCVAGLISRFPTTAHRRTAGREKQTSVAFQHMHERLCEVLIGASTVPRQRAAQNDNLASSNLHSDSPLLVQVYEADEGRHVEAAAGREASQHLSLEQPFHTSPTVASFLYPAQHSSWKLMS